MNADLTELHDILVRLRAPDGCPWDREQTPHTLRRSLVEEAYEAVESIDSDEDAQIAEELGDVLMLVTMLSLMYEERDRFSINDVIRVVSEKLVRRHPHVFGDAVVSSTTDVLEQWQRIKTEQEGKPNRSGQLHGISRALPPLERGHKLQQRAAKVGFDWPDLSGVRAKLHEEIDEVVAAAESAGGETRANRMGDDTASAEVEAEVGDMLFSAVNLARFLGVDPSLALHAANEKFVHRFAHVERRMTETGQPMEAGNLAKMDEFWNEAKSKGV